MRRISLLSRLLVVVVVLSLAAPLVPGDLFSAYAAAPPIEVNTTDVLDDPNDGSCDLYEALQAAFDQKSSGVSPKAYHECTAQEGAKEVIFAGAAAGGTITLPGGPGSLELPFITDDVTLTGPVILDGDGKSRILRVSADGALTAANLTLLNGYTSGGGGAILSDGGAITIITAAVLGNEADNDGGAIRTTGDLTILASNFAGNEAGRDGGAVFQASSSNAFRVSLSTFNGNSAVKRAGALFIRTDDAEISDTIFNGNILTDAAPDNDTKGGGAIYMQQADLEIERSVFNGNLSLDGNGGAIATSLNTKLTISKSSFNGNIAGDLTTAHRGGAIYNMEVLDIRGATFLNNLSPKGGGGAIFNDKGALLDAANSTFSANGAPDSDGGALYNGNTQQGSTIASKATFRNVTFYGNLANSNGAALFNQTGNHSIKLGNSIIDEVSGPVGACNRALTSLGHNLDSGSSCGLNGSGDLTNASADLEPPAVNGGPLADLFTHLPGENSDAIDAGDNSICSALPVDNEDQTGGLRPKDGDADLVPVCDIGSLEADARIPGYGSTPIWPGPIDFGTTTNGVPVTTLIKVSEKGNATLTVSGPTFGGPNAGDFDLVSPFTTFDIADGGNGKDVALRCTPSAVGSRTATFAVNTNDPLYPVISYDLKCQSEAAPTPGFGSNPPVGGTLDIGQIEVGKASVRQLQIIETGNAMLTYGNAALGGPNAGDFSFNAFATSIPDGGSPVNIPITCTPSGVGFRFATLSMTSNDPGKPSVSWSLVCEGTPPPPPVLVEPGTSVNTPVNVLDGTNGVAVSPDGRHLYAATFFDDAVVVYDRDAVTGNLTYHSVVVDTDLEGAQFIAVSPDGSQVYVTAGPGGNLVVLSRDKSSGSVSIVQTLRQSSYPGLQGARSVTVTPDGRFIYVTSNIQNKLLGFERLPNGDLDYLFATGITDLIGATGLSASPDGKHLYVTAYSASNTGKLIGYGINPLTGSLAHVQTITEGDSFGPGPFFLIVDALEGAWDVAVSPDGQNVYAVGRYGDAIGRFDRNPVDGMLNYRGRLKDGVTGIEGLDGANGVEVSPDGEHVYVASYDDDAVAVFNRDLGTGWISQVQVIYRSPPLLLLNGASDLVVAPDSSSVHIAAFIDAAIATLHVANPIPVVRAQFPASAKAGSGSLTVRVEGESFVPGIQAVVNGTNRPATYVNPTAFEVKLKATDLASAGAITIAALSPGPGGGASASDLVFQVTAPNDKPVPSIDSLVPPGHLAGATSPLSLSVKGSNLIKSSSVDWNGQELATTRVSDTELEATVPASLLNTIGTAVVTVVNPGPGGGTSNPMGFKILNPWYNPVPAINKVNPSTVTQYGPAGAAIKINIRGTGYTEDSTVQWNGEDRPGQYVSETKIVMELTAVDTTPGGIGAITVKNPLPGGGTSNAVPFTVIRPEGRLYEVFLPFVVR